ncbi:Hachiman antiphage defense system protein HamA [Bradyrhizobium sp. WSM1743]|uniref:Hachiman antiphage defense system protein HamA n=1 Tax=Bradyrhizobium sp. WSM1743 TaxID=318996 RepID=UPI0004819320|nr:Hachiman antiphage defense system protein HamA [Bradyrhizobium sp. WSM1743]
MPLFEDWCDNDEEEDDKKRLWKLTEKEDGREAIAESLAETVRSHYDALERIAEDVEELGYEDASAILRERLPRGKKARSGDLGEILASELTEEELGFSVPVRRMRFKDGREVALRGDDFIGIRYNEATDRLRLLKGESKSRRTLGKATIESARTALDRDDGRCTPASLLFVADRMMERGGSDEVLGKVIRREVARHALPPSRIDHVMFTMSGNGAPQALVTDYEGLDQTRRQLVVNLHIEDHQDFITEVYEQAGDIGDD